MSIGSGLAMGAALHMAEAREREQKMTTEQQFTPEYIAFMQSDEAKALQDDCEIVIGSHIVADDGGVAVVTDVHCILPEPAEFVAVHMQNGMAFGGCVDDVTWLPTLFQLIRVIEEAGWGWQRTIDGRWLIKTCSDYYTVSAKGDDVFAAAQLAVRAVEVVEQ